MRGRLVNPKGFEIELVKELGRRWLGDSRGVCFEDKPFDTIQQCCRGKCQYGCRCSYTTE